MVRWLACALILVTAVQVQVVGSSKKKKARRHMMQEMLDDVVAMAPPTSPPPSPPAATIRHLFSAPLYQSSVGEMIDVAELEALALKGFRKVGSNKKLWNSILTSRCSPEQFPRDCEEQLGRNYAQNDRFYHWQVNQGGLGQDDLPKWKDYYTSPTVKQLKTHIIRRAVPRYLHSLGISLDKVKGPLSLKLWATVMDEGATHSMHEHSTGGRCLCSGVIYAQVPSGSGPISFKDVRARHADSEIAEFFPGDPYQHAPQTGDLILFPPWLPHEVKSSTYQQAKTSSAEEGEGAAGRLRVSWAFNVVEDSPDIYKPVTSLQNTAILFTIPMYLTERGVYTGEQGEKEERGGSGDRESDSRHACWRGHPSDGG